MGHFHIDLIHFRIVESGVDFDVAENALNLFYRHSFVYGHCGEGSAEFVWVNLGSGIEINLTLLVAFSEDYTLTLVEVQVVAIHSDEFSDSHSSGGEQVYEGKIPDFCAVVAELFELLVSYGFFYQSVSAHFVDSPYWAFEYEVFIFKPREEAGEDPANVVNGDFTEMAFLLIFRKISAYVISCHFSCRLLYRVEHFYYCVLIVCECLC